MRFRDLSFMKKILAIFLIVLLTLIFGLFGIFIFNQTSGVMLGDDLADYNYSISEESINSGLGVSKSYNSSSDEYNNSYTEDVTVRIDTRDIIRTVDNIIEYSRTYNAIYESSYAGDNGYGYINLKVPTSKVDTFTKALKKDYKVASVNERISNVTGNYKNVSSRKAFLAEEIKLLEHELEAARSSGSETASLLSELRSIREELFYLENSKDNLDESVIYSNVTIQLKDKNYTSFHTFDGIWLAIKTGAHIFVIGIIYGLYFVTYTFIMMLIIFKLKKFFIVKK